MRILSFKLFEEKLIKSEVGMFTQYVGDNFFLHGGMRSGNSPGNLTRVMYNIYSKNIEGHDGRLVHIGKVELFIEDSTGEIEGLINISFMPTYRKRGFGEKLIKDLVDTTPNGLKIYDVKPAAKGFWNKMGIQWDNASKKFGIIKNEMA